MAVKISIASIFFKMKIIEKVLRGVDFVALLIGFLGFLLLIVAAVLGAIFEVYKQISRMWSNTDDRWICIAVLVSVAWCAARWKKINSK